MQNTAQPQTIRVYRHPLSGHCHRVELMLSLLGLPYTPIDVDLRARAQKSSEFLAKNAFGQIPVLEDGALTLADSNAILVYLASRYDEARRWLPADAVAAARVQRWLSVAAGQLAYGPAALRRAKLFKEALDEAAALRTTRQLLDVLERELAGSLFLLGDTPTIADVALYSYIAHAPEGGVSLADFRAIGAWLARIEALPRFVGMQRSPSRVEAG